MENEIIQRIQIEKIHHPFRGFKWSRLYEPFLVSIVGGDGAFYGDFVETFEVAVIDIRNNEFVTRRFFGGAEDVLPYQKKDDVINIIRVFEGGPSPKTGVVEADQTVSPKGQI
jgi:hypothetical protein